MTKGENTLSQVYFIRSLVLLIISLKIPPLNTISLEVRFQNTNFEVRVEAQIFRLKQEESTISRSLLLCFFFFVPPSLPSLIISWFQCNLPQASLAFLSLCSWKWGTAPAVSAGSIHSRFLWNFHISITTVKVFLVVGWGWGPLQREEDPRERSAEFHYLISDLSLEEHSSELLSHTQNMWMREGWAGDTRTRRYPSGKVLASSGQLWRDQQEGSWALWSMETERVPSH